MKNQYEIKKCIKNIRSNSMMKIYEGITQIEFIDENERKKLFPVVLELFNHPDRWCKKQAMRGLAIINTNKARDLIIGLLNDPETRKGKGSHSLQEVAIISLGKFYDKKSFNYLKKLFSTYFPRDSFNEKRRLVILNAFAEMAIYNDDALNVIKDYSKIEDYKDFCEEELTFILEERKYMNSSNA
jgi:HEAT repeat protein